MGKMGKELEKGMKDMEKRLEKWEVGLEKGVKNREKRG